MCENSRNTPNFKLGVFRLFTISDEAGMRKNSTRTRRAGAGRQKTENVSRDRGDEVV